MKKLMFVLIISALALPVFAQSSGAGEGELYYINVPVEKIYLSYEGYVIQYRKGINSIGTVGIPYSWFYEQEKRAELTKMPPGLGWPSMTIFYREGVFHHVRLYTHPSKGHVTWGVVPVGADVSGYFTSDSLSIEFN